MILQEKIRNIIFYYVKIHYTAYLKDHNLTFIDDNKIEMVVNNLYLDKKDDLKKYIRKCLTQMLDEYPQLLVENIIYEIFEDEELGKNRITTEIREYQDYQKKNSKYYKNCYDVNIKPDPMEGIGLELDIVDNSIVITNYKKSKTGGILPAESSGKISIGDKIVEINHQSLIGRKLEDLVTLLSNIGKNELIIKLQGCNTKPSTDSVCVDNIFTSSSC